MAVTSLLGTDARLATDRGRRPGRRAAKAVIVALASLSLLFAAPADSFGRSKKRHEARHAHHAVSHAAAKRHVTKHRHTKKLVAKKGRTGGKGGVKSAKAAPLPALRSAILIDAETGTVLSQTKPDMAAYPASLTKMMTLYLTFAALNEGRLSLDQRLPVSAHAAAQAPSKLWLKPGDSVAVRSLILALVTRSANDAAVVLAEALAGSEPAFAARMTETARRLGMVNTTFRNASGLPDPEQRTTARDLARLSLALHQDFPREYAYFSVRQFEFRGQTIATHNHMLESYEGTDGIKTGFTRASGFNLAASAERDGHRLIGVVLGSPSWPVRDKQMAALLDRGFAALGAVHVAGADTVEPAPGQAKRAGLVARLATYAAPVGKAVAAPAAKLAIRRAVNAPATKARNAPARRRRTTGIARSSSARSGRGPPRPGSRKAPRGSSRPGERMYAFSRSTAGARVRCTRCRCRILPTRARATPAGFCARPSSAASSSPNRTRADDTSAAPCWDAACLHRRQRRNA